jgi:hypothetical protein
MAGGTRDDLFTRDRTPMPRWCGGGDVLRGRTKSSWALAIIASPEPVNEKGRPDTLGGGLCRSYVGWVYSTGCHGIGFAR